MAAVGLTRERADAEGLTVAEGTVDLETLARTGMYGTDYHGSMTALADRDHSILVGAWAVAPLASEWIGATVLAIKARIPIAELRDTPMQFPHLRRSAQLRRQRPPSLAVVRSKAPWEAGAGTRTSARHEPEAAPSPRALRFMASLIDAMNARPSG